MRYCPPRLESQLQNSFRMRVTRAGVSSSICSRFGSPGPSSTALPKKKSYWLDRSAGRLPRWWAWASCCCSIPNRNCPLPTCDPEHEEILQLQSASWCPSQESAAAPPNPRSRLVGFGANGAIYVVRSDEFDLVYLQRYR